MSKFVAVLLVANLAFTGYQVTRPTPNETFGAKPLTTETPSKAKEHKAPSRTVPRGERRRNRGKRTNQSERKPPSKARPREAFIRAPFCPAAQRHHVRMHGAEISAVDIAIQAMETGIMDREGQREVYERLVSLRDRFTALFSLYADALEECR